jgi:hypothetical protein
MAARAANPCRADPRMAAGPAGRTRSFTESVAGLFLWLINGPIKHCRLDHGSGLSDQHGLLGHPSSLALVARRQYGFPIGAARGDPELLDQEPGNRSEGDQAGRQVHLAESDWRKARTRFDGGQPTGEVDVGKRRTECFGMPVVGQDLSFVSIGEAIRIASQVGPPGPPIVDRRDKAIPNSGDELDAPFPGRRLQRDRRVARREEDKVRLIVETIASREKGSVGYAGCRRAQRIEELLDRRLRTPGGQGVSTWRDP